MELFNSDGFIGKIYFILIKINPISNAKKYYFINKNKFLCEKLKLLGFFCSFLKITSKVQRIYEFQIKSNQIKFY